LCVSEEQSARGHRGGNVTREGKKEEEEREEKTSKRIHLKNTKGEEKRKRGDGAWLGDF